jgi:hypothetical protein
VIGTDLVDALMTGDLVMHKWIYADSFIEAFQS